MKNKNKEYACYHLVFLEDVFMVKQCKNELNPMGVTKSSWSREKQFHIPSKDKFQFIQDVTNWVSLTIVILGAFGILPFHLFSWWGSCRKYYYVWIESKNDSLGKIAP